MVAAADRVKPSFLAGDRLLEQFLRTEALVP
jgi:hypothetical protein